MRSTKLIRPAVLSFIFMLLIFSAGAQNAGNGIIEFNKLVHDFGDISLNSGKHTYTFTFKNTGKQPLVVQTVISSCGCTTPVWTRNPVKPGDSGKIEVTFLNDQGPYPFDKSLTVYVSGLNRPIILRIKGVVHEKPKSLNQLFPKKIGELSFRTSLLDLGQIAQGDSKSDVIAVANASSNSLKIEFTDLTPGLTITASPQIISPGKKGELKVTLNTKAQKNWGTVKYRANLVLNGKKISSDIIEVQVRILDNFSNLTKEDIDQAPLPMANNSAVNFGTVKAGTEISETFELKNLGRRVLQLYKYDSNHEGVTVSHPASVNPGAAAKIEIEANTKGVSGDVIYQITFVTNSPSRPVFNLLLSGSVTR